MANKWLAKKDVLWQLQELARVIDQLDHTLARTCQREIAAGVSRLAGKMEEIETILTSPRTDRSMSTSIVKKQVV